MPLQQNHGKKISFPANGLRRGINKKTCAAGT